MSLRITQSTLFNRALTNLHSSHARGINLQTQLASGRRVTRPSDDPAATMRILPLRGELRDIDASGELLAGARENLNTATGILEDASSAMQRLRELTVQSATSTITAEDRASMAVEVDQLLSRVLADANSKLGQRYIFGGTASDAAPFRLDSESGADRVVYVGGPSPSFLQTPVGIATEHAVAGDSIFLARHRSPTTFAGETGAAPSGAADSGVGTASLEIGFGGLVIPAGTTGIAAGDGDTTALGDLTYTYVAGTPPTLSLNGGQAQDIDGGVQSFLVGSGGETVSLDISGALVPASGTIVSQATMSTDGGLTTTLVDDFSTGINYQVRDSRDGGLVNVDASALVKTGTEIATFQGTFDPFTTLIAVRDLMRNTEGLPPDEMQGRLTSMLDQIDQAHDGILAGLQDLGHRSQSITFVEDRLSGLDISRRDNLARIEEGDLAETILNWNQQQLAFQASLQVASRSIQTTLLNFL